MIQLAVLDKNPSQDAFNNLSQLPQESPELSPFVEHLNHSQERWLEEQRQQERESNYTSPLHTPESETRALQSKDNSQKSKSNDEVSSSNKNTITTTDKNTNTTTSKATANEDLQKVDGANAKESLTKGNSKSSEIRNTIDADTSNKIINQKETEILKHTNKLGKHLHTSSARQQSNKDSALVTQGSNKEQAVDGNEKELFKDTATLVKVNLDREKWSVQQTVTMTKSSKEAVSLHSLAGHLESNSTSKGTDNATKLIDLAKQDRTERKDHKQMQHQGQTSQHNQDSNEQAGDAFSAKSLEELSSISTNHKDTRLTSRFAQEIEATALRENRQLYDDLVQKAKVNLRSDGSSTASIRLRPQTLGWMTMNLEVFQNQVQAQIIVESGIAKKLVMEQLHYLQQELHQQGIQVESLSIRVRDIFESQATRENLHDQQQSKQMNGEDQQRTKQGARHYLRQEKDVNLELEKMDAVLRSVAEEYEASELYVGLYPVASTINLSV